MRSTPTQTSRLDTRRRGKPVAAIGSLLLAAATLVGCGGSSSSGDSSALDPLVEDFGIAYVRQPVPETDTSDIRELTAFTPGGDLIYRDLAAPGAREHNITAALTGGMGDVKDVEVSYDGDKLLFALHLPEIEGADPEDQPTWNIWEYQISTGTLRRIIESDLKAKEGQDIAPHYLPDGRIIFSSTRQRTAKPMLLDEGKLQQFAALDEDRNEPALVLHVMDEDGGNIKQLSFNQSHDLDPTVLQNGSVVFSRWDNSGGQEGIHLYSMYPDGANLRLLYGANSHDTGTGGATIQFVQPREMPDGRLAVLAKPYSGTFLGGDILTIDVTDYVDNTEPTAANAGILSGPAQASLSYNEVRTDTAPSRGGRFSAFYPLWDGTNRALVAWSQCRLMEGSRIVPCTDDRLARADAVEAPPLYGVYIYDMDKQTQIPVFRPEEGVLYRDVVVAAPRELPQIIFENDGPPTDSFAFDPALVSENVGILDIRSVYDFDGGFNALGSSAADIESLADPATEAADVRWPARFLRIVKAVSIPGRDVVRLRGSDFGISTAQSMREIVGYAPIEPDGSVRVKVPANIPFAISVLDAKGRRITARHRNWLQLRPGEILTCNGCHEPGGSATHGRQEAASRLYAGAPANGYIFPNTSGYFADQGETMAEARTRLEASALQLSADARFSDVWTDTTAALVASADLDYLYADLATPVPASPNCAPWNALCRITINYPDHIHPLWALPRTNGAGQDRTCTSCHNSGNNDRVPAGQLDLGDGSSDLNPRHLKSYRELVSADFEQELVGGILVDKERPATTDPLYVLDANGDPVLDANGDPVPRMVRFRIAPPMNIAGARASRRFFDRFDDSTDSNHFGILSAAELKLIAEWLDIGGQYYNNPFDVPP